MRGNWLLTIAIVLGILKSIAPFQTLLSTLVAARREMLIVLVGHAAITLTTVWVVWSKRRPVVRIVGLIVTNLAALSALVLALGSRALADDDFRFTAMVYFLDSLLLVGSLWVFRVAGYRLRVGRREEVEVG